MSATSYTLCKTYTTPYHPQSDGLVERLNRTILSMLATTIDESGGEWEEHLAKCALRITPASKYLQAYTFSY